MGGTLSLAGASTATLGATDTLTTGPISLTGGSDLTVGANGTATTGTLTETDSQASFGAGTTATTGTITLTGSTLSIGSGASVILAAGAGVTATSDATGKSVIAGPGTLNLNGADRTVTVTDGPSAQDLLITALLKATGVETLIKAGLGLLASSTPRRRSPTCSTSRPRGRRGGLGHRAGETRRRDRGPERRRYGWAPSPGAVTRAGP